MDTLAWSGVRGVKPTLIPPGIGVHTYGFDPDGLHTDEAEAELARARAEPPARPATGRNQLVVLAVAAFVGLLVIGIGVRLIAKRDEGRVGPPGTPPTTLPDTTLISISAMGR